MAESCAITAKAGGGKGLEEAQRATVKGQLQEVESDLPDDLRDECLHCFNAAIGSQVSIGDAITKVQNEVLRKLDDRFAGQRFKGFIRFDYDTSVVTINVNKFGNGNSQFSSGIGTKRVVCPDPFMGRLHDPNLNR